MPNEVIPPAPYKPGIKTTEFYVTVASIITTVATLTGIIGPGDKEPISQALVDIASAAATGIVAAIYIWGRVMAKMKDQ